MYIYMYIHCSHVGVYIYTVKPYRYADNNMLIISHSVKTFSYKSQVTSIADSKLSFKNKMTSVNRDGVLAASLVLSIISLVLLFGVTWHFQSSLNSLQQQVDSDRELLLQLQDHVTEKV